LRTANLAIVFTDIKGFTERTSRQTLEENQRLLKLHADLLLPLFRGFSGKVVKSIGDAFMVTFESPTQAVLCGAAIQDRLWGHNRAAAEAERLEVRVAVNVGEVRLEGGDVFGEPVNIAARIEGITDAGEVFFTEAVYLSMNKAEVPAKEVGEFELKGIPEKVRVYQIPHAFYRVEPSGSQVTPEQPPYGNLGLSRVEESARKGTGELSQAAVAIAEQASRATAELSVSAAQLGRRSATVAKQATAKGVQAWTKLRGRWTQAPSKVRVAALVGVAVLALLAGVAAIGSPVDRAIRAVGSSEKADRPAKVRAARALIAKLPDEADRDEAQGRLEEARGSPRDAVDHYQDEAAHGGRAGVSHLIDLLESPDCRTRSSAAEALGELKATRARGSLEDLADRGGDGESDVPLFGCDSKGAAKDALRELE
jgi:class 3 adenylate cyclase